MQSTVLLVAMPFIYTSGHPAILFKIAQSGQLGKIRARTWGVITEDLRNHWHCFNKPS
jgi:hypothetical protein